jgi:hypothetical protein
VYCTEYRLWDGCSSSQCQSHRTHNSKQRATRHGQSSRLVPSKPPMSTSTSEQSSSDRQRPPKLDVEEYLTTAISATPSDLHTFFEAFQNLYSRKYARRPLLPFCPSPLFFFFFPDGVFLT